METGKRNAWAPFWHLEQDFDTAVHERYREKYFGNMTSTTLINGAFTELLNAYRGMQWPYRDRLQRRVARDEGEELQHFFGWFLVKDSYS